MYQHLVLLWEVLYSTIYKVMGLFIIGTSFTLLSLLRWCRAGILIDYLSLLWLKDETWLENKKLCLPFWTSEIPYSCCQHGPEVLNTPITTLWNQMLYPNLIFSKVTVSNWDKNRTDIHLSSHFKTFLRSPITPELALDSVHLDPTPCCGSIPQDLREVS